MSNQNYKILFVACGSMAIEGGYKTRVISEIKSIVKANSNMTIFLLCFDEFKALQNFKDEYDSLRYELNHIGVKLISYRILSFKALPVVKLITAFYISFIILLEAIKLKVQIIHAQNHIAGLYAIFTKLVARKLIVLDVHGVRFAERVYGKRKQLGDYLWVDKIAYFLEEWILKKYDGLIFVSHAMSKFYRCTSSNNYAVVPCCVDTDKFKIYDTYNVLLNDELHISERFIVTYNGTFFTTWQEPNDIVEIFNEIKSKIPHAFLLILSGDDSKKIKKFILNKGILEKDVGVYSLKHDSVPQWLSISNLGLLIRRKSVVNTVASPTKFGEYLSCGVPVVISENVGDFSQIVSEQDIGLIARYNNNGKIIISDEDIKTLNLIRKDIVSSRCRKLAIDLFDWSKHSMSILNLYETILKG
ncbi:MAG: glycosyltransferase [Mastigocoleus sp. MO_167.B18]|nr:glycosyltransferase [Mastigocoleus sp. MO_167.B18]